MHVTVLFCETNLETQTHEYRIGNRKVHKLYSKQKARMKITLKSKLFDTQRANTNVMNPLTPNDPYSGRTAPLTSKRCILYIYSTNTDTEYFKRGINSPFLSLQNAVCFIILTYLVPILFTFYIQDVLK